MARAGAGDGGRVRGNVTGNMASPQAVRGPNLYPSDYAVLPPLWVAEGRRLPRVLWEPHCGTGSLVNPLRRRGFTVTATDLHDWGCPDSVGGIDFLGTLAAGYAPAGERWGVIANPPFDDVAAHIERATKLAPYAAFFLRFSFFEGLRYKWFPSVGLQRVHLISDRLPMMHGAHVAPEDRKMEQAGMAFAWFIFEPGKPARRRGDYLVRPISWKESAKRYPQHPGDEPVGAKELPSLFTRIA